MKLTDDEIDKMWTDNWDGFVSFEECRVIVRDVESAYWLKLSPLENVDVMKMYDCLEALLNMHDAEVWVKEPWDSTFEEVRELLNRIKTIKENLCFLDSKL